MCDNFYSALLILLGEACTAEKQLMPLFSKKVFLKVVFLIF